MANKRIINQTTTTTLSAGDYTIIDNSTSGTKKYDIGDKLNTITNNIGNLSNLNTSAKTNLVAAINEAATTGGSGGGSSSTNILIVTDSNGTLNKTLNEIITALNSGTPVFVKRTNTQNYIYRLSLVTEVFKYGSYDWRVAVEQPMPANVTGKEIVNGPSIGIYSASTTSAYPIYYTSIVPSSFSYNDASPT